MSQSLHEGKSKDLIIPCFSTHLRYFYFAEHLEYIYTLGLPSISIETLEDGFIANVFNYFKGKS